MVVTLALVVEARQSLGNDVGPRLLQYLTKRRFGHRFAGFTRAARELPVQATVRVPYEEYLASIVEDDRPGAEAPAAPRHAGSVVTRARRQAAAASVRNSGGRANRDCSGTFSSHLRRYVAIDGN